MATAKLIMTAGTLDEINKLTQDMVHQGWHSDRGPYQNADRTYSVEMSKDIAKPNPAATSESF